MTLTKTIRWGLVALIMSAISPAAFAQETDHDWWEKYQARQNQVASKTVKDEGETRVDRAGKIKVLHDITPLADGRAVEALQVTFDADGLEGKVQTFGGIRLLPAPKQVRGFDGKVRVQRADPASVEWFAKRADGDEDLWKTLGTTLPNTALQAVSNPLAALVNNLTAPKKGPQYGAAVSLGVGVTSFNETNTNVNAGSCPGQCM